ncbi:dTMP kinase [soil metagenome]
MDASVSPRRGLLITLEGPDGAGKSIQASLLAERLVAAGARVALTREPGGTALGERIRELLLDVDAGPRDPLADAMLFNAARRQLVADVLRPALADGLVVICDRFTDSTLAYQGYGAGAPLDTLAALAALSTDGLRPDRTVLLDLPAEVGLARRRGGDAAQLTRFELDAQHDRRFHERVRHGFLELAGDEPDRWRVVDASRDPAAVSADVWAAVMDLFAGPAGER